MWSAVLLLGLALLASVGWQMRHPGQNLTQDDIDAAVRHSLEKKPLPSRAAKAYEAVAPSVVRVVGLMSPDDDYTGASEEAGKDKAAKPGARGKVTPIPSQRERNNQRRGQGTGVVIVENGTILTNFHVVHGASKVKVEFHNGLVADAEIINTMLEHDLAVLKADRVPDDLQPATLRGTGDLRPGDEVLAVGFPFGIGPSASAGVVSGLKREFRSGDGERVLTNLIQFDAAANPGNSGGPLVTMEGEVVGIVTAILNPTEARTFIGIGFAVPIENAAAGAGMPPF
jgi:S1-C subfamily serine protease